MRNLRQVRRCREEGSVTAAATVFSLRMVTANDEMTSYGKSKQIPTTSYSLT
jgi:hypothetical protein